MLRNLPFWLLVLAIPLVCAFPVLRFAPAIYGLGRRRVYRLSSELKRHEDQLTAVPLGTTQDFMERLDQMEGRASRQSVPASIRPLLYWLRSHIKMVREDVARKTGAPLAKGKNQRGTGPFYPAP